MIWIMLKSFNKNMGIPVSDIIYNIVKISINDFPKMTNTVLKKVNLIYQSEL